MWLGRCSVTRIWPWLCPGIWGWPGLECSRHAMIARSAASATDRPEEDIRMDQKIIDLYDEYTHAPLDRRVFLARLAQLTGSTAAALALVPLLEANQAHAALVSPEDQRLETGRVTYAGATGDIKEYMGSPKGEAKVAAVMLIRDELR